MDSLRHTISSLLLCSMLLQCVGWVVVFHVVRKQARRDVRARIMSGVPTHELVAFKMDASLIGVDAEGREWEHDGEFKFHDVMYDVVRVQDSADKVVVYVIADLKESALYQRIALETKQQTPNTAKHSPLTKLASQLLGNPFIRPSYFVLRPAFQGHIVSIDGRRTTDDGRQMTDVETPPPEGTVANV